MLSSILQSLASSSSSSTLSVVDCPVSVRLSSGHHLSVCLLLATLPRLRPLVLVANMFPRAEIKISKKEKKKKIRRYKKRSEERRKKNKKRSKRSEEKVLNRLSLV